MRWNTIRSAIACLASVLLISCGDPVSNLPPFEGTSQDLENQINSEYGGSGQSFVEANPQRFKEFARENQTDMITVLLEHDANPNFVAPGDAARQTPLASAIGYRATSAANLLVANGSNPSSTYALTIAIISHIENRTSTVKIRGLSVGEHYLQTTRLAYQLGDRSFLLPTASTSLAFYTGNDPSKRVDVGAYGALVYADIRGDAEMVQTLQQLGVRETQFNSEQTSSLNRLRNEYGPNANQNNNAAQLFAGLAIIAGAGYLASEGGGAQAAELLAAGLADVTGDGTTTNLADLNQQTALQNSQAQGNGGIGTQGGSAQISIPAQDYTFNCPHTGAQYTVLITGHSAQCREVQKKYAVAASCNLIDTLRAAEQNYYSVCAGEIFGN